MDRLRIGQKVQVASLPSNVADDVKQYLHQVGIITSYSDPSLGQYGYYVQFGGSLLIKKFYHNELQPIKR